MARQLYLLNEKLPADEALRRGMVHEVFPAERLREETLDRARTIGDLADATTRERLAMLEGGLSMVEERPIFGVGPGQVRRWYEVYAPAYAVRRSTSHLHNSPLQVAAESGLPGLALWLAIFVGFLVRGVRILLAVPADRRDARALVLGSLAAVSGFLLAGLFEYNFGDSEVWLVAATFMALPFVVARERAGG